MKGHLKMWEIDYYLGGEWVSECVGEQDDVCKIARPKSLEKGILDWETEYRCHIFPLGRYHIAKALFQERKSCTC